MEVVYRSKASQSDSKPVVSLILLDWSCRESFHSLDYLNNQTVPRDSYEILWIEYYTRKPSEIEAKLKKNGKSAVIDQWIVLGMPEALYYHKHLMYNIGIVKSHGDIVVICDSDAIYESSFIETIIKSFEDDPDIVLHLDQVRNIDKKFYPFSSPSIKKLLGKGCINFQNGKTTGLWDETDSIHSRNYGACMAAKRDDLIAIGGADEHIDFLGHVCGPYDMTFRLRNLGKREVWHDKEFLYHTWHPGQSGDANYVGPHDGRLISTTALEVLESRRIRPLVENKAIEMLRTGNGFTEEELGKKLVDSSYVKLFSYDMMSKKRKMQLWHEHELLRFYRDYNIIRYRGILYGVPAFLRLEGLDKELKEKVHPTLITDETVRGVKKKINKIDPLSLRPKTVCQYKGCNIIQYGRRVYGAPQIQELSSIDFHDVQQRCGLEDLSANTVEEVKELIDKTDRTLNFPIMLEAYKGCSLIKFLNRIYGVPQSLGKVDFYNPHQRCELEDLCAGTVEEVKELIDKTDRTIHFPSMLEVYKGCSLVKFVNRIYGIPHSLGKVDVYDPQQLREVKALSADTVDAVKELIDKSDESLHLPIMLETYKGCSLVKFLNRIYGVPQCLGKIDFYDHRQRRKIEDLSADTVEAVKELIDKTDRSLYWPTMLETYKEYSIVKYRGKIYGVPRSLGKVDFYDPQQLHEIEDIFADTIEAVRDLIDKTDRSLHFPVVLYIYKGYSIVKYQGKVYGVPQALGKVDLTQKPQRVLPGILSADKKQKLVSLIEENDQLAQKDNICLLEKYERYNIVSFRSGIYGVPENFGPVSSICKRWLDFPGVISADNCDQVKELIRSANLWLAMPFLLYEYKNYNVVLYDGCYYAAPHSIGNVDFCNEQQRSHPEIISAGSCGELEVRIDKLEKAVPVEYTGWLPQFREFGNCGSHPQFRHIKRPPEGYRFTYSEPAGNGQLAKKTLRQRISLLASYNPLSTIPLLLVQLFFAAFKLALSAWSKGANWHYIFHFFKTRGIKLQLLIPRKRNLLFLPSVPYTLGQHPWVIEIEDSISLLFPFIHNGSTDPECLHRSPYFPIFKALFESRSCRAIVTHIKSTAENLPKLFQSNKLASKIEYVPLGVETPAVYHKAEEKDDKIRILFNNSWHQDPRSFFVRGGLDVLGAFDELRKKYPDVSLTLRTSLPSIHPHYEDIIVRNNVRVISNFIPDKEWEELMSNSNIYLLPSDRVHVVSMLEAMSYGLAVVVSDGWGVGDYVQHGHNGMVVKGRYGKITWVDHRTGMLCERYDLMRKEDPVVIRNITETLSSLIEDKQLRHRISQQARKDVKDKYNLENWNKGLKRAFDRALGVNAKV